jgi:hypothetical protein
VIMTAVGRRPPVSSLQLVSGTSTGEGNKGGE